MINFTFGYLEGKFSICLSKEFNVHSVSVSNVKELEDQVQGAEYLRYEHKIVIDTERFQNMAP